MTATLNQEMVVHQAVKMKPAAQEQNQIIIALMCVKDKNFLLNNKSAIRIQDGLQENASLHQEPPAVLDPR